MHHNNQQVSAGQNRRNDKTVTKNKYVILHYSVSKTIWDWTVLAFTLHTAVVIPMTVAFRLGPPSTTWLVIDSAMDIFFLADVAANFHTTYMGDKGILVTDLKTIRWKYATTWFVVDILSCLPYDAVTFLAGKVKGQRLTRLLSVLKALRLLRMVRIAREADRYLERAWATLIVMTLLLLLISHWMACAWYTIALNDVTNYMRALEANSHEESKKSTVLPPLILTASSEKMSNDFDFFGNESLMWGDFENKQQHIPIEEKKVTFETNPTEKSVCFKAPPKNWLLYLAETTEEHFVYNKSTETLSEGPPVARSYIAALYFTLKTVTSVGFGNIGGETQAEQIYCVFIMVLGGLLYAVILGSVTNIIQQLTAENQNFLDELKIVRKFSKLHEIPSQLTESIHDYMTYTNAVTHGISVEKVLNYLPEHKKTEIRIHLHRSVLNNQQAFKSLDQFGVRIFAEQLRRIYVAPKDILCKKGEMVDGIYFIVSGSVEVMQQGQVVALLSSNDCFGTYVWREDFTTHISRGKCQVTVRTLTYASLDFITLPGLIDIMEKSSSVERAFQDNLSLTYDLCYKFHFRSFQDKQWDEEHSPAATDVFYQMIIWLRKLRSKKRHGRDTFTTVPKDILTETSNKQRCQARRREKSSTRLLKFTRDGALFRRIRNVFVFLRGNRVDCEPGTSGESQNDRCSCSHSGRATNASSSNNKDNSEGKKQTLGQSMASGLKCQKCGKKIHSSADNETSETKRKIVVTSSEQNASVYFSHAVAKDHMTSDNLNENVSDQIQQPVFDSVPDNHCSKITEKTESNLITAVCYHQKIDSNGQRNWVDGDKIGFTLESKKWMNIGLCAKTKDTLQLLLDCKANVRRNVLAIDKSVQRLEKLVEKLKAEFEVE